MTTHEPEPAGVIPEAAVEAAARALARVGDPMRGTPEQLSARNDAIWGRFKYEANAALLAAQPFMVEAEPVAWRYRFDIGEENLLAEWTFADDRPRFTPFGEEHAASSPAPEAGKAEGATKASNEPWDGLFDCLDEIRQRQADRKATIWDQIYEAREIVRMRWPRSEEDQKVFDLTNKALYGLSGDPIDMDLEEVVKHMRAAYALDSNDAREVAEAEHHKLDTDRRVFFYEQDFYVLSNFSSFELLWSDSYSFKTAEHCYHWLRFATGAANGKLGGAQPTDEAKSIADAVRRAPSAHEAFKIAQANKHLQRADWNDVKVEKMRMVIRAKTLQHEYVSRKLLATGDRELIEDSWRDDFWGWGPDRDGQNMLGKLWMEVRSELRAARRPAPDGGAR